MLDQEKVVSIAEALIKADETKTTIPLIAANNPGMTIEDAYAVQKVWAQKKVEGGATKVGRKIGLTSKVMQQATGIDEPDYGVIFDDMVFDSGSVIDFDRFSNVRIEVEIAFGLKKPLKGPNVNVFDVLDATSFVVPALEVLNSHVEFEGRTVVDNISDNAAMGVMVLGAQPTDVRDVDLRWAGALLYRNESIEDSGVAGAVLGHPAQAVAWLANKLAAHGQHLEAGEIILSGSFTKPMWVERGDTVHAEFGSLGGVTCRFE